MLKQFALLIAVNPFATDCGLRGKIKIIKIVVRL